jgi:hypothetical protein
MEDRIEKNIIEIEKAKATTVPTSIFDFSNVDRAWRFAEILAKSAIIPDTFKLNPASCLIALDMANRMRRNPLEVMQALYIVHGRPSFSSSFLISLINSSGFYEPLRFKFDGQDNSRSCVAWTTDKRTGETVEGPRVSIQMAKEEGWYGKPGSKWKTMPEVMLRYRAASFFSRAYCPDLVGGFHTTEEIQESQESVEPIGTTFNRTSTQDLQAELTALSVNPKQPVASLPGHIPTSASVKETAPQKATPKPEPEMLPEPEQKTVKEDPDFPLPEPTVTDPANLVPIDPEMLPLDMPVSTPQTMVKPPSTMNLALDDVPEHQGMMKPFSESEKLRDQLRGALSLNFTAEESEAWCAEHFKKGFKQLTKDDLRLAISKINAELDAQEI